MKKSYRDLFIWQRSVDLAVQVIECTRGFPQQQRYVLVDQMQRCAVSVASNIAEGKGRLSPKELRQFLAIARGSLFELETQMEIATRVGLLSLETYADFDRRIALIGTGITRLLAKINPYKP
jgi:four helix bundle protein